MRWPVWFQTSKTARDLLGKQPAIHKRFALGLRDPEQRALVEEKFRLDTTDEKLVVHYVSSKRLCGFYKCVAQWILDHYREHAVIEERYCLKRGGPECEISVSWT